MTSVFTSRSIIFLTFLLILCFLIWRVDYFISYVFDEYYYAAAAVSIYEKGWDINIPHPILGKAIIAFPLYFFGAGDAIYWRISSLVFGYIGLIGTYLFARKLGLNWKQGLGVVLCLVGSKGWYLLSRIAMLDIFVAFFTLIIGYLVYLYFEKYNFSRQYDSYDNVALLTLIGVVIGLAGSVKLSGFFPLLFFYFAYLFYFEGTVRKKLFDFLYLGATSGYTFVLINTSLYGFDLYELLVRTWQQAVFHNSAMLPEVIREVSKGNELSLNGGWIGLIEYLFFYKVYYGDNENYLDYAYSNNPVIALVFVGFTLWILLSLAGYIVRRIQKINYFPLVFSDKKILFLYFFGFFQIVTWGFIPRVSYVYYFVTAFPFVLLLSVYYLHKYASLKMRVVFYSVYFAVFLYQINLMIPI